jgi:hypothetical protein
MRLWTVVGALAVVVAVGSGVSGQQAPAPGGTPRWLKGNTHTHTLNSDGDSTPDDVVRWYREQHYQFVVLTDHNTVTATEGLNAMMGGPDRFLVVSGEEVTAVAGGKPVHLNLIGTDTFIAPQGGATPAESLRSNVAAMLPTKAIVSINHPNFRWALTAEDLLAGKGAHLLEIANAHPQVNNGGSSTSPSAEALWDSMLSAGIRIYGVASDDMHELKNPWSKAAARPGQGWIMVRAARLLKEPLLDALAAGEFYASTGVELTDVLTTEQRVSLTIKEQNSVRYTVSFIGKGGRVLKTLTAPPYQYDSTGSEGYVRAKVVDSNGLAAWTQPVFVTPRTF